MASEELARKLQSRFAATQEAEMRTEPMQSQLRPKPLEPEAACGESSSELCAKLTRRLDINEGNAVSRLTHVFNPYTEFKEFTRKQIKNMEAMFKRAAAGELQEESGLMALVRLSEIDVSAEGVMGAKDFFEAKQHALSLGSKFEAEIREEKEERKRQDVAKKQRQATFKQLQSTFCS